MLVLWLYNWDYEPVSPNRKLNLITWWICFSFKKVDRRSAVIHVFTKTQSIQGSRKVVRFMQNEPQFILYRASWICRVTNRLHYAWTQTGGHSILKWINIYMTSHKRRTTLRKNRFVIFEFINLKWWQNIKQNTLSRAKDNFLNIRKHDIGPHG